MRYIERRPDWIEAIHECIRDKWEPICNGCIKDGSCALCTKRNHDESAESCKICPLGRSDNKCNHDGSTYDKWSSIDECSACSYDVQSCHNQICPDPSPELRATEAFNMLEALIALLPIKERGRYES